MAGISCYKMGKAEVWEAFFIDIMVIFSIKTVTKNLPHYPKLGRQSQYTLFATVILLFSMPVENKKYILKY